MTDAEEPSFVTMLTGLADYYRVTLSDGVIRLYWTGLKQLDLATVEQAFLDHINMPDNGQFMPKVADLNRLLNGRTGDQSALAWGKVETALRHVSPYRDVVFDDPVTMRVLADMGGWIYLCKQTEDELPFVAKRFQANYQAYRIRNQRPDFPPVLTGIANAQNQLTYMEKQPPILIGVPAMAQRVMKGGTTKSLIGITEAGPSAVKTLEQKLLQ